MNYMDGAHDPGGKVRLPLSDDTAGGALFSPCDRYRYRLRRSWPEGRGQVMFLMMNPSTANAGVNDPTVAKCGRYARAWGFCGLLVGNVCAYRSTNKNALLAVDDPMGPENLFHLEAMAAEASMIVVAHGRLPGGLATLARDAAQHLVRTGHGSKLHALRASEDGTPWHPLYLPGNIVPAPWSPS